MRPAIHSTTIVALDPSTTQDSILGQLLRPSLLPSFRCRREPKGVDHYKMSIKETGDSLFVSAETTTFIDESGNRVIPRLWQKQIDPRNLEKDTLAVLEIERPATESAFVAVQLNGSHLQTSQLLCRRHRPLLRSRHRLPADLQSGPEL